MTPSEPTAVYTVADFVRRVVDSLLRGDCRGMFLCARCLVKLTRDHLDKSYSKTDITQVMEEIFSAPGALTHLAASPCGVCGRKKAPCLGVTLPARPQSPVAAADEAPAEAQTQGDL